MSAGDFVSDTPRLGFPRAQMVVIIPAPVRPFYATQVAEAVAILNGLLDRLVATVPAGGISADVFLVRNLAGKLRVDANSLLRAGTLGARLKECYDAAVAAKATLAGMSGVRAWLFEQVVQGDLANVVIAAGICFALSAEGRIIASMKFASQDDAQIVMDRMVTEFEQAKLTIMEDELDAATYQAINRLAGDVLHHIAETELQLPRRIRYVTMTTMPTLSLAYAIYGDASRYDEIRDQNKIVHPAFCPRELVVLSN